MILLLKRLVGEGSKNCATSNRSSTNWSTESIIVPTTSSFNTILTEVIVLVKLWEALLADLREAEAVSCNHEVSLLPVLYIWGAISVPLERSQHFVLNLRDRSRATSDVFLLNYFSCGWRWNVDGAARLHTNLLHLQSVKFVLKLGDLLHQAWWVGSGCTSLPTLRHGGRVQIWSLTVLKTFIEASWRVSNVLRLYERLELVELVRFSPSSHVASIPAFATDN